MQSDPLEQFYTFARESLPVELVQAQIVGKVEGCVSAGRGSPAGMFEFFFMNVYCFWVKSKVSL